MRKLLVATLAALAATSILPLGAANEGDADCQDSVTYNDGTGTRTGPQPWIGYTTTNPVRTLWYGAVDQGQSVNVCEGEHWDGQDTVQPGQNPGSGPSCTKGQTLVDPQNGNIFIGSCMEPDPNVGGADPLSGNGQPATLRVSEKGNSANSVQVYAMVDIALVGRSGAYAGHCSDGGAGLEGSSSCAAGGQDRVAWYGRDNTLGNLLAQVISATGLTKGHAAETDCDQSTYQSGAFQNRKDLCGRDNTAITVDLQNLPSLLP